MKCSCGTELQKRYENNKVVHYLCPKCGIIYDKYFVASIDYPCSICKMNKHCLTQKEKLTKDGCKILWEECNAI